MSPATARGAARAAVFAMLIFQTSLRSVVIPSVAVISSPNRVPVAPSLYSKLPLVGESEIPVDRQALDMAALFEGHK